MPIRYQIDLPVRSSDRADFPPDLLRQTLSELFDEFGLVQTMAVYRSAPGESNPDRHEEWIRFWFDPREVSDTHEWIARWWQSVLTPRYRGIEPLVVWFHPAR